MSVYFAQSEETGLIKIGYTTETVHRRLCKLRSAEKQTIHCLGYMSGAARKEAALHRQFEAFQKRGEWFEPDRELLAFIEQFAHRFTPPPPRIYINIPRPLRLRRPPRKMLSVTLPVDMVKRIRAHVQKEQCVMAWYVEKLINRGMRA